MHVWFHFLHLVTFHPRTCTIRAVHCAASALMNTETINHEFHFLLRSSPSAPDCLTHSALKILQQVSAIWWWTSAYCSPSIMLSLYCRWFYFHLFWLCLRAGKQDVCSDASHIQIQFPWRQTSYAFCSVDAYSLFFWLCCSFLPDHTERLCLSPTSSF